MNIFQAIIKLLTFKITKAEILSFNKYHFIAGLLGTWIVGIGRHWDDNDANRIQHLGLGSIIYIFVLAFFIWLIIKPLHVEKWNYFIVLTFISLTSFPAIFYAIPVEKFFDMETAKSINIWFLAIVALWRLCLLYYFIKYYTEMSSGIIWTVTLMPICLIISLLTMLNMHEAIFNIMGGVRNPAPQDTSSLILSILTGVSMILCIPLLFSYMDAIYTQNQERKEKKTKS